MSYLEEIRGSLVVRGAIVDDRKPPCRTCGGTKKVADGMKRLVLTNWQSPGDIIMITAAVRDLHAAFPGIYATDVRTSAMQIWDYNPHVTKFPEAWIDKEAAITRDARPCVPRTVQDITFIPMQYPLVNHSNQYSGHFVSAFHRYLADMLGLPAIPQTLFKGDIHLSHDEQCWMSQVAELGIHDHYWIINSGGKWDYTAKWPNPYTLQAVVDHFLGKIVFVQVGDVGNWQPELSGVVNLVGKTDLRQLLRLVYNSMGVLTPMNGLVHMAAAVPVRAGWPAQRACVVLGGGREPTHWEAYPQHRYLSTQGCLPCCTPDACWISRCTPVGDEDEKDKSEALCKAYTEIPAMESPHCRKKMETIRVAKCLDIITADQIIAAVESYYHGGNIQWPK